MTKRITHNPGEKIGILTFQSETGDKTCRGYLGEFTCECGGSVIAPIREWRTGVRTTCGSYVAHPRRSTHGETGSGRYRSWQNMRTRCRTPFQIKHPTYAGITHEPSWSTYEGFLANPPQGTWFKGAQLARYGDVGNYTPENTSWITAKQNRQDTRHGRNRLTSQPGKRIIES